MGKKEKKQEAELLNELQRYYKKGVSLWLNGRPSTPKTIVKAHRVAEAGAYMRDYVENTKGEVERLEFDLIKE